MVLISLKSTPGASSNNDGFLYETTVSARVDDLIESLVEIHNARVRSCLVSDAVKGLATYGVMKRPENAGTDAVSVFSSPVQLRSTNLFCAHGNTIFKQYAFRFKK